MEFFQSVCQDYDSKSNARFYAGIAESLLDKIPSIPCPRSILEVGAGTGFSTTLIKRRYPRAKLTAIEPVSKMLDRARVKVVGIDWVCRSLADFDGSAYDLVTASMSYQWLAEPERRKLSALAERGTLALAVPVTRSRRNSQAGKTSANADLTSVVRRLGAKSMWPKAVRDADCLIAAIRPYFKSIESEMLNIREKYDDPKALVSTLTARGVLLALFGDKISAAQELLTARWASRSPLVFDWSIELIVASSRLN